MFRTSFDIIFLSECASGVEGRRYQVCDDFPEPAPSKHHKGKHEPIDSFPYSKKFGGSHLRCMCH